MSEEKTVAGRWPHAKGDFDPKKDKERRSWGGDK